MPTLYIAHPRSFAAFPNENLEKERILSKSYVSCTEIVKYHTPLFYAFN